jgi:hypothetical protein
VRAKVIEEKLKSLWTNIHLPLYFLLLQRFSIHSRQYSIHTGLLSRQCNQMDIAWFGLIALGAQNLNSKKSKDQWGSSRLGCCRNFRMNSVLFASFRRRESTDFFIDFEESSMETPPPFSLDCRNVKHGNNKILRDFLRFFTPVQKNSCPFLLFPDTKGPFSRPL